MHVIPQSPVRKVKVITVIEIKTIAGEGTSDDPTRNITQYWDMDGNLLAVADPEAYGIDYNKINFQRGENDGNTSR